MTALFNDIIFGPVHSRRLGHSLGVNLLPAYGKFCTFDCIYCECGWNADHRDDATLPTREQVFEALEHRLRLLLKQQQQPDAITFSGNGEPTLHPQFADIITDTIALRDKYVPFAKVCVLSNATNLSNDSVVAALQRVDKPILKIDAADESLVRLINQPQQSNYSVAEVVRQLQRFHGAFTLQTLFLRGEYVGRSFDNSTPERVESWLQLVQQTRPREIMLYTIARDTPLQTLQKLTREELDAIAENVAAHNTWGAEVVVSG